MYSTSLLLFSYRHTVLACLHVFKTVLELHVKCWSDHNPAMHNHFEGNGVGGGGGGG